MSTQELPKDIGGYQHLAPDVRAKDDDVYVLNGVPHHFVGLNGCELVGHLEDVIGMNIYRRIPVAKQGDCDTTGWKTVAEDAAVRAHNEAARAQEAMVGGLVRPAALPHDQQPGVIAARALGCNVLPQDPKARKNVPIYSGFLKYFPRAAAAVAELSRIGNDQHNPGKPLHWDRSKSGDELDALCRHLLQAGTVDTDGIRHSCKVAWRAMANLEKELEKAEGQK